LVNQIKGKYKVLDPKIQPLFLELWNLRLDFKKIRFRLIKRENNKEADKLVNEILNTKTSS
jgi:ribonuclease HI